MSITRFKGTVYPDKTFTLGIVPTPKKNAQDRRYDRDISQQEEPNYGNIADWLESKLDIGGKFVSTSEAPLFIKSPESSRKPRGTYGSHGITAYGKRVVRNTCILLEQKYSKERLGFITCTLPSYDECTHRYINGNWGEITRRFYQKLRRISQARGREFIYVGVTEIQEKRFKRSGIPVPHLHFVYLCSDTPNGKYLLHIKDFWKSWNDSIYEVLTLPNSPVCMDAIDRTGSTHGKRIQKSAAAYLGKYVTKGVAVLEAMRGAGWLEFPKQWWTASMQCKRMYAMSLIHLTSDECALFYYCDQDLLHEKMLTYVYRIYIDWGGYERQIGLYGVVSDSMYALLNSG